MYFAVVKLQFEPETPTANDRRELRSLVEKIRAKFKVAASVIDERGSEGGIAIAALGSSEERLSQTLDAITDFCENSGFGRIASEHAVLDHIDSIEAEEDDAD